MLMMPLLLGQASPPPESDRLFEMLDICAARSRDPDQASPAALRATAKARGWTTTEADLLITACKSYADGQAEGRAYIKAREGRAGTPRR